MSDKLMYNFTPRAQKVLALARKEAERFNHNFAGTEHLLLGLIKLGQGVAVNVLQKLGIDLQVIRQDVENEVGMGPDQKHTGPIPYTPRVKKVLSLAEKEAKMLNRPYVGTEHILLGLLREGDGVAAKVLNQLSVFLEETRRMVIQEPACSSCTNPTNPVASDSLTANPQPVIANISLLLLPLCAETSTSGRPLILRVLALILEQLISTCYSAERIGQILSMKWTGPQLDVIAEIVKRAHSCVLAEVRNQFTGSAFGTLGFINCGYVIQVCDDSSSLDLNGVLVDIRPCFKAAKSGPIQVTLPGPPVPIAPAPLEHRDGS